MEIVLLHDLFVCPRGSENLDIIFFAVKLRYGYMSSCLPPSLARGRYAHFVSRCVITSRRKLYFRPAIRSPNSSSAYFVLNDLDCRSPQLLFTLAEADMCDYQTMSSNSLAQKDHPPRAIVSSESVSFLRILLVNGESFNLSVPVSATVRVLKEKIIDDKPTGMFPSSQIIRRPAHLPTRPELFLSVFSWYTLSITVAPSI